MERSVLSLLILVFVTNSAFARHPKRRALVLGIDGCMGTQLHQRVWQDQQAPHIQKLMIQGKFAPCQSPTDPRCARAQSAFRKTRAPSLLWNCEPVWVTSPGWASVLTGADVDHHGVTDNEHKCQKAFSSTTQKYPTFFATLKNAGFKTAAGGVSAFLTSKSGSSIGTGILDYECGHSEEKELPNVAFDSNKSCNLNYRFTPTKEDDTKDEKLTDWLLAMIAGDADVIMGVLDHVDSIGHRHGFSANPEYMAAISAADSLIGKVLAAIEETMRQRGETWLLLLSSDHGGHKTADGGGHATVVDEDEVVPFVVAVLGEDIKLKDLDYPVRHMDVNPTLLKWFAQPSLAPDGKVQGLASMSVP